MFPDDILASVKARCKETLELIADYESARAEYKAAQQRYQVAQSALAQRLDDPDMGALVRSATTRSTHEIRTGRVASVEIDAAVESTRRRRRETPTKGGQSAPHPGVDSSR